MSENKENIRVSQELDNGGEKGWIGVFLKKETSR